MAGSAREEAERLVATVLAMAAQSGRDGKDKDETLSGTAHRVAEGLGALGETVVSLIGGLPGMSSDNRGADAATDTPKAATTNPAGSGSASGGSAGGGSPGSGSAGGGSPGSGSAGGGSTVGGGRLAGLGSILGGPWATGSAECCVCPLCRVIAGMRDPTPQTAERLAAGAGDFAMGAASLLRAVSAMTSKPRPKPARPARPAPPTPDEAWSTATRAGRPAQSQDATGGGYEATDGSYEAANGSLEAAAGGHGATAGSDQTAGAEAADTDVWAAASAADAKSATAERRAAAARKAAKAQAARAAAEAARAAGGAAGDRPTDDAPRGARPAPRGDVWAAATAVEGGTRVAPVRDVDHDVAGPAVETGRAGTGSAPAAAAAEDPGAGAGDDARTGDGV